MHTVAVILARAGSKGLPDKCVLPLCGRPVIAYTIGHAQQSRRVDAILLTTDSPRAAATARQMGVMVIDRPPELAADTATTQDATRHAVGEYESRTGRQADVIVALGGNTPLREDGIIDRCIDRLVETGCDSVQTVGRVGKHHPDWMYRLESGPADAGRVIAGRMSPYRPNNIVRRQDLEPLYGLDGAVVVVRRAFLFAEATASNPTAYLGQDRHAVVQEEPCVDIDTLADFYQAEAMIRVRNETTIVDFPTGATRRRAVTAAIGHGAAHDRRHF